MTKQEWDCPLPEEQSLGSPIPPGTASGVLLLFPGFSSTKTTTAGSQGRKSNPATERGKHSTEVSLRISYQVTSQQLHLAILGNSPLPSLPSIMKHHIQHLGGAVPHCLGTFHSFFFSLLQFILSCFTRSSITSTFPLSSKDTPGHSSKEIPQETLRMLTVHENTSVDITGLPSDFL